MELELRVLGNTEARAGDQVLDLGHPRQRCVLAALVVEAGSVVTTDQLLDRAWGEQLPLRGRDTLYSYLSRLRQVLAGHATLVRRKGGYVLDVHPDAVDVHRFRALVRRSDLASLDEALALWRGPAFADLDTPWITGVREALDRERRSAVLDRNDLALRQGRHADLLNELFEDVEAQPLDERLAGQLMLALYRSGRQADALHHYQKLRDRLADELGGDPSPPLRQLHAKILRGDVVPLKAEPPPRTGRNDLPRDIADFTGREDELRLLLAAVPGDDAAMTAVVIEAIDGMAGVGKTALAVHLAHRLQDRYPDARLFIDLHGHSNDRDAVSAGAALESLLRALGVPADTIPDDVDERSALWRAELAERRVLVVLDNAADSAQVQALLPGAPRCLALVTSRRRLVDLPTTRTVSLDVMPVPDAVALFTSIVGEDRAAAEPDAVHDVVSSCGCLPLAVRLAAARLRSRPQWTIAHLARRLHDAKRRLSELSAGDLGVTVAFDLSYRNLSDEQQLVFRVAGLHPGDDFDVPAAAALAGLDEDTAEEVLEDLVDVHLLQQPVPGRYRFHDLLRHHANTLAAETGAERCGAVVRLIDHYLRVAGAADAMLIPPGRFRARAAEPTGFADADEALAWFEAEHAALLAVVRISAEEGRTSSCWQLAAKLQRYLYRCGWTEQLRQLSEVALAQALRAGDRHGEAVIRTNLGLALYRGGQFAAARKQLTQALPLFRALDDRRGENQAIAALGNACKKLGRFDEALVCFERDLELCRQDHDRHGEAVAFGNLGAFYLDTGRYAEPAEQFTRTLTGMRETGDRLGESTTLGNLGELHLELGELEQALQWLDQGLELCRAISDRHGEARTLITIGEVHGRLRRSAEAREHHEKALSLIGEIGSHSLEASAFNGLGRSLWHCGDTEEALTHFGRALGLARSAENPLEEAEALAGLGQCFDRQGDRDGAARAWERAHRIFAGLNHRRAEVVAHRL